MNIKERLKNYRKILAEKKELELRINEQEEDIGIVGIEYGERSGPTYKITSQTENQALKLTESQEKLIKLIKEKGTEIQRLENAMSVLTDQEREVIELLYIKKHYINTVAYKVDKSPRTVKYIERAALKKMEEVINYEG